MESKENEKDVVVSENEEPQTYLMNPFENSACISLIYLFFYDEVLPFDLLQKSIDETVDDIPILSSVIKKNEELGTNYFECVKPSNVTFIQKEIPEEVFDLYKVKEDECFDFSEGMRFYEYVDRVDAGPSGLVPKYNVSLTKFTLLTCGSRSIFCFSINHSIADAHSCAFIMNKVCSGKDSLVKNFEFKRPKFVLPIKDHEKKYPDYPSDEETSLLEMMLDYHPFGKKKYTEAELYPSVSKEAVKRVIRFSRNEIMELKKLVKVPEGTHFSSYDVVSAVMWMFWASYHVVEDSMNVPFRIVANLRGRIQGFGNEYIGNSIVIPNVSPEMTRKEIFDADFTELVMSVRKLINSVDEKMAKCVHTCIPKYADQIVRLHRKHALILNDWRVFERIKPDYVIEEEGKRRVVEVKRQVLWPKQSIEAFYENMWFMHLDAGGGIHIRSIIEKSTYEKMKHLKFNSLEDIRKIRDLFTIQEKEE